MKVVEIISDTNVGGAGRLLLTRLKNSNREGIDRSVILPRGSKLEGHFADIGVTVHTVDGCRDRSFDIGAIVKLVRILREISPDIVNCHGALSARIAAAYLRIPVRIYTRHCTYPVPLPLRLFPIKQLLGGVGRALSPHAIAVAHAAQKDMMLMGYPEDNIKVIINGVEGFQKYGEAERTAARRELGVEDKFVVGICARVEKCKDHDCFLRAARILSQEDDRYRFIVVGEGSLLAETMALADSLGIADKVIFTGFVGDVERYMNCFDLNVNCSVGTETSSLALSEGMSIGLPAVASSYGGNPYMVRHGENGFIYSMGDFCELADMIRRLAQDSSLYERASRVAYRRFLSELNAKNMTEQTEDYYLELYSDHLGNAAREVGC